MLLESTRTSGIVRPHGRTSVKILVSLKQVVDPDQSQRLRVGSDGRLLDSAGLDMLTNPFDEYALEAALRLTEDGRSPKLRLGQVLAMTVGKATTEVMLRSALALGADEAIRVDATDETIDALVVSKVVARLAQQSDADLVVLGKQSVDGDGNEMAQRVAAILDWPQITCATAIEETSDGTLRVRREVDGGMLQLAVRLPAVISVDLRIIAPNAVRSRCCPRDHAYPHGVRYASLPSIIAAKRKSLSLRCLTEFVEAAVPLLHHVGYELSPPRVACKVCGSVDALMRALTEEAKVF
jgi:electron transfer flavoprotein beta subunit